jgi:hypothetical protein
MFDRFIQNVHAKYEAATTPEGRLALREQIMAFANTANLTGTFTQKQLAVMVMLGVSEYMEPSFLSIKSEWSDFIGFDVEPVVSELIAKGYAQADVLGN